MSFWTGVVEGVNDRRQQEFLQNYQMEQQNRQMADKVFGHLLASRDPEMQQLALQGMLQPITKSKGVKGFMGGVDQNPFLAQVVQHMNELVPDTSTANQFPAATPPPQSGSAALPPHAAVDPGAPPVNQPPAPTEINAQGLPTDADAMQGVDMMPPPPPPPLLPAHAVSQFKRRGTGVPTAEEIAESTAKAQLSGKIAAMLTGLRGVGAGQDMQQRAVMGLSGAPPPLDSTATVLMADPTDPHTPIVTMRHRDGHMTLQDGVTPVPPEFIGFVKPPGQGAGGMTSFVRDTPEVRKQYGLAQASPTGYWHIKQIPGQPAQVMPGEYTPPPAYSGTTDIQGDNGVAKKVALPRQGGKPVDIGTAPSPDVQSQTQKDAEALLAAIDDEVKLKLSGQMGRLSGVTPEARNQIARQKAQAAQLPYQSYDEVVRAAKATAPQVKSERNTGGSLAEKVRARAIQNRQGAGGATGGAAPGTVTPPVKPSFQSNREAAQ